MYQTLTRGFDLAAGFKIGFAVLFAVAGVSYPISMATTSFYRQNESEEKNDSRPGLNLRKPNMSVHFPGSKSKLKDLEYSVSGLDKGNYTAKIRMVCTYADQKTWISQNCGKIGDKNKLLSRPYHIRKNIPRTWKPKHTRYGVYLYGHNPDSTVISSYASVMFEK